MNKSELRLLAQQIRAMVSIPQAARWVGNDLDDATARHPCPKCEQSSTSKQTLALFDDGSRYYCYHCREGGDVVSYLAACQRCAMGEVIANLAARLGLSGDASAFVKFIESEIRASIAGESTRTRAREIRREYMATRATRSLHSDSAWSEVVSGYWLAERAATRGVEVPGPIHYPQWNESTEAHDLAESVMGFYRAVAVKGRQCPDAASIIARRNLQTPDHFGVVAGPVNGQLLPAWLDRRGELRTAIRLGLIGKRDGKPIDYAAHRVVFPIRDIAGRVCAFAYRVARDGDEPKYRNTRDSEIYAKRETLYGASCAAQFIARSRIAVLVEGYADVIAMHRSGIRQAVALCGTALASEQAELLSRLARVVVIVGDADDAGRASAKAATATLRLCGVRVGRATPPAGLDPEEWIAEAGPEAVRGAVIAAARKAAKGKQSTSRDGFAESAKTAILSE